jgi:ribosomal protein S18 acetylase RimI-like enzyme
MYISKITLMNQNLVFKKIDEKERIPYELLLLADPSITVINEYLKLSDIFVAKQNEKIIGVIVVLPLTAETAEIKNIAVDPEFQGKGIGSFLIEQVVQTALFNNQKNICIGTANSSIGQLYLYQKLGFEITEIKRNFFLENYTEPIYENGIQAKHMIVLKRILHDNEVL